MSNLEVADIFRDFGEAWRQQNAGRISCGQLKVMTAIERCRTAELGGHVLECQGCGGQQIAYNSCRDRHCPKCQGSAAHRWIQARQSELLPVEYFHVVFTLPSRIRDIAYQNKEVIYNLLFKAASQTLLTIGKDPKHLGAKLGITAVLHTWGSALTHHPHVHCIVTGGGLSKNKKKWIACRQGFFLPVKVLSRLYRRLFLEQLERAHLEGQLNFYGKYCALEEHEDFMRYLNSCRSIDWVVYAKRPFAGPQPVLRYLSNYTHRVAIANSRLIRMDQNCVTFKWKDYREKGEKRFKQMTIQTGEFIRRFLLHVLPPGFHRIRHYGILSNKVRKEEITLARTILHDDLSQLDESDQNDDQVVYRCRECGEPMNIIGELKHSSEARAPPQGVAA